MADEETPKKTRGKKDGQTSTSLAWSILASLKRPFGDRDSIWPVRRRIRMRQEDPPVPEAYQGSALKHKSAELDWAVRQIVSMLSENREQYIVYAPKPSEEMHQLADEFQKAISALNELLEDRHPIERPRALSHDAQVADGIACEKITFDWDFFEKVRNSKKPEQAWKEAWVEYVRKHKELPIRRVSVDTFTLYWEFDINGLVAVAEHGRARVSALAEQYEENKSVINALARIPVNEGMSPGNSTSGSSTVDAPVGGNSNTNADQGETVAVLEVWTRKEFFLLADNGKGQRELLLRQKHPHKRPPYFFAPGILTGSQNPLHQFQPLVLPMYPLALELSAVRTARLNAAFLSSFKPFYVKYNNAAGEDEESANLKVHFLLPGANIPSLKGGEIVPIQWTNLDELEKMENSLMGDRERFGFQAVLAGNMPASGESTAWATRMMRDQGLVQFNGVLRNYANMREEEMRFIIDFVRDVLKMDMPIARRVIEKRTGRRYVDVIYLTQKMAEMGFDIQCRLTAGKASDRISIVEEFRRAHEAGEVPMRMVREEGWQFENATEIEEEVLDEQIRKALLPQAIDLIVSLAQQGAEEALAENLPPSPEEAAAQAQQQADAQAQEQAAMEQQAAMQGGGAPGGEIPGGVAEPGLQQSLTPQEIPPDEPYGVMLP